MFYRKLSDGSSHQASSAHKTIVANAIVAALLASGCGADVSEVAAATAATQLASGTTEAQSVTDGKTWEVRSFASERGISYADAQHRLEQQARVGSFSELVKSDLGSAYGGTWIDVEDNDRIKVAVTQDSLWASAADKRRGGGSFDRNAVGEREAAVDLHAHIDARAQQSGITDYDTVSVKHSFAEIERANEWLSNELAQARRESADFSSGMLPHRNQVRLGLPPGGVFNAAQGEVVAKAKTQLGDMLLVEENPGHFELDVCAYPNCDAPLRGGIGIDDGTSTCTAGFVGESRVDSKLYLFTVGHCISDHTTNWFAADSSGNRTAIGAAWNHIYGDGGDMAIIRINDVVNWDPQNWVYVSDGNGTTVDEEYPITSVDYSTVGKRVCASGAVSGASNCGTVQELGVSRGDVNNLGRASYCRVHGDSGAPIFSYNVGYGLHHAGDDSCDAYFQSLKWAEEKMNVNALTSPR